MSVLLEIYLVQCGEEGVKYRRCHNSCTHNLYVVFNFECGALNRYLSYIATYFYVDTKETIVLLFLCMLFSFKLYLCLSNNAVPVIPLWPLLLHKVITRPLAI